MKKRVLLSASYSIIEPLGLLHLGTVAKQEDWEIKYVLVKDNDFSAVDYAVHDFRPDIFGFTFAPTTFFERSILNFPNEWYGLQLSSKNKNDWLNCYELEEYKDNLQFLRDYFDYFAMIKDGDQLFRKVLAEKNVTWKMCQEV